jgi:hypothetical protein
MAHAAGCGNVRAGCDRGMAGEDVGMLVIVKAVAG